MHLTYYNQILALLKENRKVATYELINITHRFSEPIRKLRRAGYNILTIKEPSRNNKQCYSYLLIEEDK